MLATVSSNLFLAAYSAERNLKLAAAINSQFLAAYSAER
jgi:hypothetical protein